jgi:MFS family permease
METKPTAPDTDSISPSSTHRRRVATAAALASAVEWYDYFIFGTAAALIFGKQFFPSFSPVAGVLASFATFAVGFGARPLGGILAGHLGDKHGRKPMLVMALACMGLATTIIGLLPPYATIGILAPIILVLLRLLQGIAVGAQWGGAMLLATEYAPEGKRGIYGSLVQLGVPIGVVLANSTFLVAAQVTPASAFTSWGWRLPFLVGVLVIILAWYIHTRVEETPEFRAAEAKMAAEERARAHSPLGHVLRNNLGTVLLASGSFIVNHATFYIIITGVLDYTTRDLHMARNTVLMVSLLVSMTQLVVIPAAASVSDRVGRLRVYTLGAAGLLVWAVPMFLLIDTASIAMLAVGTFVGSLFLSIMYGPQAALFAELFDAETRYTGASLGYQISGVLGGGLAPFIMVLLLESTGTSLAVSGYIIVLAVIALLSIAVLARRARATRSASTEAQPASG